jgi:hypothetical protein
MKKFIIILIFPILVNSCCNNTQQTAISPTTSQAEVTAAVGQFVQAMLTADESILKAILDENLVFGHSGGKVQNKSEFITEILTKDPFVYTSIETLDQTIQLAGDAAVVRHIFTAETINVAGEPGSLRVGNVMVWRLQDGKLKLLARQAYRLQ